ncbi:hypothetical protein BXY85_1324 [Roseivirga pacifica]|uniref:Uncharacterized protein n=1 Tax=Roseivirga pacifica TaxID=1267423 RepID=A0A1I0MD62_9BACT|nr:hypothetical protein [Roseivirga pacifica]MCO6358852.1 hypothetical protein [Roseivirga pacifica]MCO6365512.1 hypothetical protein [Roseivirga pacifica]MCO6371758.1 hypothetical protein [Roseivirga pacifica]MCO6376131.1 hypothetical protein [Roseivirga pacifica]MCO6379136.1 hypothetical protein [Roseivirga pacifica]
MLKDIKDNGIMKSYSEDSYPKKRPAGFWERLLCRDCEEKLQKLEDYAAHVLYGSKKFAPINCQSLVSKDGITYKECFNIHYTKFKVFLLSLIWRMSITTEDFFKEVDLGIHEEAMRMIILNFDTLSSDKYPVLIMDIGSQNKIIKGTMESPRRHRKSYKTYYSLKLSGFMYIFYITKDSIDESFLPLCINETEKLTIVNSSGYTTTKFLKELKKASDKL